MPSEVIALRERANELEFKAARTKVATLTCIWAGAALDMRDKADMIERRELLPTLPEKPQ